LKDIQFTRTNGLEMQLVDQLLNRNPFEGSLKPSRVPILKVGRPTMPFPHPGNYRQPLEILKSIFHDTKKLPYTEKHNRYLSVPGLPYVLVTRDPDLLRSVLIDTGDKEGQFDRDPSPASGIARATGVDTLLYSNGEVWKRQKKLAAGPFGRTSLFQPEKFHEFEQTFRVTVAERLDRLRKLQQESGQKVTRIKLELEIQVVMLEMLVNNFFGANVKYEEFHNRYVPAISRLISFMIDDTVYPRSRNILKNIGSRKAQLTQDKSDFDRLTKIALSGRREGKGLWGHFKSDAPDEKLFSNMRVFLAGALEATSSYACWTLSHLSYHQKFQNKIYEEVKDLNEYDPDNLKQAKNLNTALTETLRITPSLYFLPRQATVDRLVKATDDLQIMIPEKTHVVLDVWHSNRHEDFWGRELTGYPARKFAPERWDFLASQGKRPSDLLHFGFGHGPRVCPGKYLGLLEVGLVVGAIIKIFKLKAVHPKQKAIAGVSTKPADGCEVYLEIRNK